MADLNTRSGGVREKRSRVGREDTEGVCAFCWGPMGKMRSRWSLQTNGVGLETREELCKNLPEEILEKIFARLPVRSLFKMRTISKAWRTKLRDFLPFQAEVKSVTSAWQTHGPIDVDKTGMRGFDAASKKWETLFRPWNIPNNPLLREDGNDWKVAGVCGYLICFMRTPAGSGLSIWRELDVEVSNPMNESWRKLPRLETKLWCHSALVVKVVPAGEDNYMIVVIGDLQPFYVYIYSSATERWTEHRREPYPLLRFISIQYFESRVYFLYEFAEHNPDDDSEWKESLGVELFHVEHGTWERRPLPFKDFGKYDLFGLLVCQSSLMMVGVEKLFALLDEDACEETSVPSDMRMLELFDGDWFPDSPPAVSPEAHELGVGYAECSSSETLVECKEILHLFRVTDAWTLEEILTGPPEGVEALCFLGDFYNDGDRIVMTALCSSETRRIVNASHPSPSVLIYDFEKKTWDTKQLSCEMTEPYYNSQCTFTVGLNPFIVA